MFARLNCSLAVALAVIATGGAFAQTSQPAAALDPRVERVLDRLEARGKTLHDVQCDLEYIKIVRDLDSKSVSKGILRYLQSEPNPLFFIRFDNKVNEGIESKHPEWFVFDGRYYIEAREAGRSIQKHEVLKPGERRNLFRLGEGPFPVPFGQKKSDIVSNFTVKLMPAGKDDPADSDHLECTPKPGTDMHKRYETVHFWISQKTDLPVKVSTVQKDEDASITAIFRNLKANAGLPASDLNLPPLPDYTVTENKLEEGRSAPRDK